MGTFYPNWTSAKYANKVNQPEIYINKPTANGQKYSLTPSVTAIRYAWKPQKPIKCPLRYELKITIKSVILGFKLFFHKLSETVFVHPMSFTLMIEKNTSNLLS